MPKASGTLSLRPIRQFNVLLVQCNPADSLLTIAAFRAVGLTNGLHCVPDVEEAIAYVLRQGRHSNVPIPDWIFLDLSQPRISALEVLKVVKSTPALMHIPVVVAAGSDDPKFVRSVYALNGNCFIQKPGELGEFVRFIEACYAFWGRVATLAPHAGEARLPSTPCRPPTPPKTGDSRTMTRRASAGSRP
jgi:CheY-like chemotaxis protein